MPRAGGHLRLPKVPGQGHLRQRLTAPLGNLVQRPRLLQGLLRDLDGRQRPDASTPVATMGQRRSTGGDLSYRRASQAGDIP